MRRLSCAICLTCAALTAGRSAATAGVALPPPLLAPPPGLAWERSTPEAQGIHSEILVRGLRRIREEQLDTHGIIIIRNGRVILECYVHPYGPDTLHNIKSVSKSVISALTGIALREDILESLDQTVHEFFPQYITDEVDPRKRRITIRHLLCMSSGLDLDENGPIMQRIFAGDDWIAETFARPMAGEPGERFVYSTPLTHTLSGILTEASGQSTFEFARRHLFDPLDIESVQWTEGRDGYDFGGSEVFMTPRDMAKFGMLFLNGGRWQGRQVVPAAWVEASTRAQLRADSVRRSYGYGWWPGDDGRYAALGWGGQRIAIDPDLDLVVAATAGGSGGYAQLFQHLAGYEPSDRPLPPDPEAVATLEQLVDELAHPQPRPVSEAPALAKTVSGQRYLLDDNPRRLREIVFDFSGENVARINAGTATGSLDLEIGLDGIDRVSDLGAFGHMPRGNRSAHRGAWTAGNTFTIDAHELGNPMHTRMVVVFTGDELEITSTTRPVGRRLVTTGRKAAPSSESPRAAGGTPDEERPYVPPNDPLVAEKLREWQGLKFGLLMHWGPYSQWGVVESWSICGEDVPWARRKGDDYVEYKRQYENLKATFDPRDFDPERWARAARDAGMRYVVFTTKHHDGFCMFDTKLTDYTITDSGCPFHDHPLADVTMAIFDAFRAEGLWTGAYFSKPDWHSEDYWWPYFPTPDRNVNYEIDRYPERWERFIQYTHGQIEELVTRYGPLDILWLDGGWVRPLTEEQVADRRANPAFRFNRPQSQDIRMDELAAMARRHCPGLIVVDRAVPGVHQNYLTPENRVPGEPLPFPWESCIISGGGWSHSPNATYMSIREGVHLLIDIVAKGGNLLLNVAPGPDGRWQDGAYDLLEGIGHWMQVNGDAIYGSLPRAPYKQDNVCALNGADGSVHAIVLAGEGEDRPPSKILVPSVRPAPDAEIRMLGNELLLTWEQSGNDVEVTIPNSLREDPPCQHAWVLRIPVTE